MRKADGSTIIEGKNVNGMYLLNTIDNFPNMPTAMSSLSQPVSLEQWHRCLTHCSPLTIKSMLAENLIDGLALSDTDLNGKCEDCIMGRQTR